MDNVKIKECFSQPTDAEEWAKAIEKHVAPWVEAKNKGYWELVLFVCKRRDMIEKNLGRERFAELLISMCPDAVDDSDTPQSLKYNMDKFKFNRQLNNYDKLPDAHVLRDYVRELENMFDQPCQSDTPPPITHTMEERIEEYLNKYAGTQQYARVIRHPTYGHFSPTISVEQFISEKFKMEGRASHIIAFECVNTTVDTAKVNELAARYMNQRNIKLYIASPMGFSTQTQSIAIEHNVGLIRVNPELIVNEHNFVLPRESSTYSLTRSCFEMFLGEKKQTVPFIIRDGRHFGTSLATELHYYGITINAKAITCVPVMLSRDIEKVASLMIKDETERYIRQLNNTDWHSNHIPVCKTDLDLIIKRRGLKVVRSRKNMRGKVASIDMRKRIITINDYTEAYEPRERFSISHEIGHDVLHRKQNISIFDESAPEIDIDLREHKWMEYQANTFATYLLMPEPVVRLLFYIYWRKEFHQEEITPLVYSNQQPFLGQFQRVVGPVSRKMGVSLEAMKYRLQKLGLLVNK